MSTSIVAVALGYRWTIVASAVLLYVLATCIYRRYFHPLAKIPGPFLPAVTKFYQTAFNARYYKQIDKLHQRYGPIVRIAPDEVHLQNAEHYGEIYKVGSNFSKSPVFYNALCVPNSSFGTPSNEVHRIRRGALNPMFSPQKVLELESIVQDKVRKVTERMQRGIDERKPVDLHHILRAVSLDVASQFAFDRCYDCLDQEDIGAKFFEMARGIGPALWAFQQFPRLQSIALSTPPWMAPYLSKPLGYVTGLQMECVAQIEGVKAKMARGESTGRQTIFTTLLTDDESKPKGYQIPTTWQIKDEAYSILAAAADTTGNAMTVATFNVLHNPAIYQKLVDELETRYPEQTGRLPLKELEKLPYLVRAALEDCSSNNIPLQSSLLTCYRAL